MNRNIERNQFPSFTNYRSMIGWCNMNYPQTLVNPIFLRKEEGEEKYDLDSLFQEKCPPERKKVELIKPFASEERRGVDFKAVGNSSLTLSTCRHGVRGQIFERNHGVGEEYSAVRPLECVLGPDRDGKYERRIRQIGEVYYNPPNEGETMRHLKKMPNTVLNEHNLLEVMGEKLSCLDLQYRADISNELIDKVGYLSANLRELNLTAVPITSAVLVELGKSCRALEAIDISLCGGLQEFAILRFLEDCPRLRKLKANHLEGAFTDACLQKLEEAPLEILFINFCSQISSAGFTAVRKKSFLELGLSSLPLLSGEDFSMVLSASSEILEYLDLSLNCQKDLCNSLMLAVGPCLRLKTLVLTGCSNISDEGLGNMSAGDKAHPKQFEGFPRLTALKVGGLSISDQLYQLCKRCPQLAFLEANNLDRLTDHFMDQVKQHPALKTILINFTPNINEDKLREIRETHTQLKIIRNIVKMTDPKDDGLRMPLPLASMKIKKKKKKKKK